jgi:hypothetical protein
MKKFAISLIALAAISTASFASQRGYDLRDSDTYFGKYSTQLKNEAAASNALVIVKKTSAATNFDRLNWTAWENDMGGGH